MSTPLNTTIDTKTLRAVCDTDTFLYRCGFAADAQARGDFLDHNPDASAEEVAEHLEEYDYLRYALANVKGVIQDIQEIFNRNVVLYLTGQGNFREHMATILPYKGNRDTAHRPKYYKEIKAYMIDVWNAVVVEGREADDALSCDLWQDREGTVLVTIDKDLDNTPGWHYNWVKKELYYVDEATADRNFWLQVLTGDRTDNIQGIPGIGPAKAAKIMADATDWFEYAAAALTAYEKAFGDKAESYLYENCSLLWMQRVEGINFDDQPYKFEEHPEELNDE